MKKALLLLLFATVTFSIVRAQNTEIRLLPSFSRVSVGEAISLILIPGNKNEAKIKASNIDLDDIETDVIGSKLRIGLSGSRHRNINVTIVLTYIKINSISVSSAADVTTKGSIRAESLDISVSSAADAELEITAKDVDIEVSSSGILTLSGAAVSQRVEVSSAAEYDGSDLACEDAYVKASSAASARVHASKRIEAKASSAGSVKYFGNPDKVYVNANSGGYVGKGH